MRTKGHNFERHIPKKFKELGFPTRTTRAASTLLDGCGIDLVGTPFIIQCKAGYEKRRPKFEEEYRYIHDRIFEHFGENHPFKDIPTIIIHQLDAQKGPKGRKPEDTYVMMTLDDLLKIVETHKFEKILNIW